MSKRILFSILSILLFSASDILAQDVIIKLSNSSFEDFPRPGREPRGWYDCGGRFFQNETPPDVHPVPGTPAFEVTKKAHDGETYLGMVVRENDSWESVGQRLSKPLEAGKCYTFSIYLATSKIYKSSIRGSNEKVDFNTPIKLRIWGGRGYCNKGELLAESGTVSNTDWKEYQFKFEPKQRTSYIMLEAFFKTPVLSPPNGNILLDKASDIQMIPCDEELPVAKKPEVDITNPSSERNTVLKNSFDLVAKVLNVKEKRKILLKVNGRNIRNFTYNSNSKKLTANIKLKEGTNTVSVRASNSEGKDSDETTIIYEPPVVKVDPPPVKKSKMEEDLISLGVREKLKVEKLAFEVDSYEITEGSKPVLDDIFNFLRNNNTVKIEIGGHTNRFCDTEFCDKLSKNRAKSVVDYLIGKGISKDRLTYVGYGKREMINFGKSAEAQRKNQRVEIKITSKS